MDSSSPTASVENRKVLSVSELNHSAKRMLEGEFSMIYVEGEISNFAAPRSGHWYFTLKDNGAQLRCAMFKNRNQRIRFVPRDGMQIIVRGKISLFEQRGEYQMIAEHVEEAGDGQLRRAFEQLKMRLQAEGLFDEDKKQAIPKLPERVAVITSQHGAAIHDVLTVMQRRFPAMLITILPVQVQGDDSIRQISEAISLANRHEGFDLILLTRGGGSLEDLWSFNTEQVARAIAASQLPVVCAVGHESDVSIADFVADLRAPTPSAAAELITPNQADWLSALKRMEHHLVGELEDILQSKAQQLDHTSRRLRNPLQRLGDLEHRLEAQVSRLNHVMQHSTLERLKSRVDLLEQRIPDPISIVNSMAVRQQHLASRLARTQTDALKNKQHRLTHAIGKLEALSPLKVLNRGYAIVSSTEGHVITDSTEVSLGSSIVARVAKGEIIAEVKEVRNSDES